METTIAGSAASGDLLFEGIWSNRMRRLGPPTEHAAPVALACQRRAPGSETGKQRRASRPVRDPVDPGRVRRVKRGIGVAQPDPALRLLGQRILFPRLAVDLAPHPACTLLIRRGIGQQELYIGHGETGQDRRRVRSATVGAPSASGVIRRGISGRTGPAARGPPCCQRPRSGRAGGGTATPPGASGFRARHRRPRPSGHARRLAHRPAAGA